MAPARPPGKLGLLSREPRGKWCEVAVGARGPLEEPGQQGGSPDLLGRLPDNIHTGTVFQTPGQHSLIISHQIRRSLRQEPRGSAPMGPWSKEGGKRHPRTSGGSAGPKHSVAWWQYCPRQSTDSDKWTLIWDVKGGL